jgi:hypothetical protein
VRSRSPPGEATCPARCDHNASRPDPAHGTSGPRLNDLAPQFAPNGTERRLGSRSQVRAKEPVREATVEISPPGWNCPASARQRHTGSNLGFCLRVKRRTFSLDRKRSSDWQAKKPPDLRSPLTESNRRPSPYHAHFRGFTARQALPAGRRQAPIWLLPRPAASAIAQAIAPAAEQYLAWVQAQRAQRPPAPGLPFKPGLWGGMPAIHVHSDGQRTVSRSFLSRPPMARSPR